MHKTLQVPVHQDWVFVNDIKRSFGIACRKRVSLEMILSTLFFTADAIIKLSTQIIVGTYLTVAEYIK